MRPSRGALLSAGSLFAGLVVWEIVGRTLDLLYLPPATSTLGRLWELVSDGSLLPTMWSSLQNLIIGFLIAVVGGVVIGTAMARIGWLEKVLDPYVYMLLTAPSVVFVPVYFAIFGLSHWAIVCLIVQYSMFIIVVNTVSAVKAVEPELIEMARVYGVRSELVMARSVLVRAAFPMIAAGLRLGLGRAIKGMVNGEILIAVVGLGYMSQKFGAAYDSEGVLAVLLAVIIVALVLDKLVRLLDTSINHWLPDSYK